MSSVSSNGNGQPYSPPFDDDFGTITSKNGSINGDGSNEKDNKLHKANLIYKDGKEVSRTSTGKRKFHNKSKNGCDTCKKRRVKCDEGKPICTKCQNMGIDCHYSIPVVKKPKGSSKSGSKSPKVSIKEEHHDEFEMANAFKSPTLSHTNLNNHSRNSSLNTPNLKKRDTLNHGGSTPHNIVNSIDDYRQQQHLQHRIHQHHHQQPEITFPTFSVKSPSMEQATLSIRSAMLTDHTPTMSRNSIDSRNNLSINLNSISNNPTISPQPSMSPGSATSPLSTHQQMNGGNGNNNNVSNNIQAHIPTSLGNFSSPTALNMLDLRLMYHYTKVVAPTITTAGISEEKIWSEDIPQLAFNYPFLMHSILAFSATHLSRTMKGLENCVTSHRGEALRLLREAVLEISSDNTDALVASALILIMDSLANASLPTSLSPTSLPASAWIFHVKGAATILTAVWPLPVTSRFYKFISVDLSDLGDIINEKNGSISELVCFDDSIGDLYPVEYDSPYLITLAYLDKLHKEKYKSDFILRIFAFPALLDKTFLALLMSGDLSAMRIMRSYYSLLRGFTTEMKDKVWFLEGVSKVLPADVDDYSGGGGMHMMLDFLGGGLPSMTTTNLAPGLNIDINDHFMNP